jgi:hypothetical protein
MIGEIGKVYSIEYVTDLAQTNDPTAWRCLEYEASKHMPYITSIEEMGRQEGRQEGHEEGFRKGLQTGAITARQKAVFEAIEVRFGEAPESIRTTIDRELGSSAARHAGCHGGSGSDHEPLRPLVIAIKGTSNRTSNRKPGLL